MRFLHLSCVALILAGLLGSTCFAGELARFSCTEYADRDWPRMLVGYNVSFPRGKARPGNIRLVDDQGGQHPVQLAAIKTQGDGSIQSCRVHFYAELTPAGATFTAWKPESRPAVVRKASPAVAVETGLKQAPLACPASVAGRLIRVTLAKFLQLRVPADVEVKLRRGGPAGQRESLAAGPVQHDAPVGDQVLQLNQRLQGLDR